MDKFANIFVAGHRGLVGSAILRALTREGFRKVVCRTSAELDLRETADVRRFFEERRFDYVFLAAAKVGGIVANNDYPADFIRDNLMIQTNVIEASRRTGVGKLLFLGSTCIYPKLAPQPLRESYLLTGALEPTNEPYAIAKIAGIKMCQSYNRQYGTNYISVMPTNLYGPHDNFDFAQSHVLPALIRKFHEAKLQDSPYVTVWGTGTPRREFLHADDLADACLFLMDRYDAGDIINVGTGEDLPISELASRVASVVGYRGDIRYDTQKPDGTPRKLVDVSKLTALGWTARTGLDDGLRRTYEWYLQNSAEASSRYGLPERQGSR
ncbi:GDP-L-fucose synthase [Cohnella nanjingensis]|uniref:GDP-L-fucose synthase n=1 Tax=Cohnella nanjingensis TaxID=1387779 RepID=A0A7X0RQ83_9BACL|nr:GDP-L-fucose synthase [Cohnella nanjingensis]MBB6671712.1 GDP-L-fucose synthase [Cohnella nanjingensis]